MTEAEILQLNFSAIDSMANLFSIFFGIVSAYIVCMYFFLYKSPIVIRLAAFVLLTIGLLFLGQSMADIEVRILGLIEAWTLLGSKTTGITSLGQGSVPLPIQDVLDWVGIKTAAYDGTRIAIYTGWIVSAVVYAALIYATFVFRWPARG